MRFWYIPLLVIRKGFEMVLFTIGNFTIGNFTIGNIYSAGTSELFGNWARVVGYASELFDIKKKKKGVFASTRNYSATVEKMAGHD